MDLLHVWNSIKGTNGYALPKGLLGTILEGEIGGGEFVQCGGKAKDSPHGQAENSDPAVSVTIGATCKYIRFIYDVHLLNQSALLYRIEEVYLIIMYN